MLTMLLGLIKSTNEASPALLERAFSLAEEEKELDVMVDLVARPDATPSILKRAAASRRLEIRAAYYTRTPVTPEQLTALSKETTTGALQRVAASTTDDSVLATLLRGNPSVVSLVMLSPHASPVTRSKALAQLDEHFNLITPTARESFRTLLDNRSVGALPTGTTITNPALALMLLPHIPASSRVSLVASLLSSPDLNRADKNFVAEQFRYLGPDDRAYVLKTVTPEMILPLGIMVDHASIPPEVEAQFLKDATARADVPRVQQWARSHADTLVSVPGGLDLVLATLPAADERNAWHGAKASAALLASHGHTDALLTRRPETAAAAYLLASTTQDPEVLKDLSTRFKDPVLLQRVLTSPSLPDDTFCELVAEIPLRMGGAVALEARRRGGRPLATALLSRVVDVSELDDAHHDAIDLLLVMMTERPAPTAALEALHDPRAEVLHRLSTRGLLTPARLELVDDIIGAYPAALVIGGYFTPVLAERARILFEPALENWETFTVLAQSPATTFKELLAAVETLS